MASVKMAAAAMVLLRSPVPITSLQRRKCETVEEWLARGNKIEHLPPDASSGCPMNEWRSSYDDA